MKYLRVTLSLNGDSIHPMHRFVSEHGGYADYRLIHWNQTNSDENALLFHVRGDEAAYAERLGELDRVRTFELASIDDDAFYVYVREEPSETDTSLVAAFGHAGLIAVPPITYRSDRTMTLGVVGDPDALQQTLDRIPAAIDVAVDRIGDDPLKDTSLGVDLTDRQRAAVRAAQRLGYYAVPREAAVEDVADAIDCAPGTAAEHLRKAESRTLGDLDV